MGNFSSERSYDRTRILEAASRARSKKRYRKAAALYRRVLAVEPRNLELHARLAPLLAATGQGFDAWQSFCSCAEVAAAEKRLDQAAAIYREAARCLPREREAWERLAATERQRGRSREAVDALREGHLRLRGGRRRAEAIHLLRRAREIEPWDPTVALPLTRLLARSGQEAEAQLLLEQLAGRVQGSDLRRVRGIQWRIAPTLPNTWRWLRATLSGGRADARSMHA